MDIKTYDLILDTETKHTSIQVRESFAYDCAYFETPVSVFKLMTGVFRLHEMPDEYAYMMALNNKMKLMGVFEIGHGTGNACLVDARGVYMRALQIGANCIMLVHNHPSGIPRPSRQDIQLCQKIKEAGEMIGIGLMDFIIIGDMEYFSFLEKDMM